MTVYTPKKPDGRSQERATDGRGETRTMGEVNHTNPETGESFGDSMVFTRGRVAIVDGGEADAVDDDEDDDEAENAETIGDIDHTPREDAPDASKVYERGGEGAVEGPEQEDVAEVDEK